MANFRGTRRGIAPDLPGAMTHRCLDRGGRTAGHGEREIEVFVTGVEHPDLGAHDPLGLSGRGREGGIRPQIGSIFPQHKIDLGNAPGIRESLGCGE